MQERLLPTPQPLTARSVVLSTLLGYHPPALPLSALIRVGALFGMAERTVRVAISRMVSDGDLVADGASYRLSDRLVARQAQQEDDAAPRTRNWRGVWQMAVVTAPPRPLAERVALRKSMVGMRLAELREGVWARPANLVRPWADTVASQCTFFEGRPSDDPVTLARKLWDLDSWADEARRLEQAQERADGFVEEFLVIADTYRHLHLDPVLPPELLPPDWPGGSLRARHATTVASFAARLRHHSEG